VGAHAALLGIVSLDPARPGYLARLSPRTLKPVSEKRVRMRGHPWAWRRSPDGGEVALGGASRATGDHRCAPLAHARGARAPTPGGAVTAVAWRSARRLVALVGADWASAHVAVVYAGRRRAVRRVPLRGEVVAVEPSALGLVLLFGRPGTIGPASLVRVDAAGRVHRTSLARISAGFVPPPRDVSEGREPVSRHAVPGLAVDEPGGRAFVMAAGAPLMAEIDLRGGVVSYHELHERVSLLRRLRDWLEPAAHAKDSEGALRSARWLGNGRLAVSGEGETADGRVRSFGLRLVDASDWSWRVVDADADYVVHARDTLLVAGVDWDPATGRTTGHGLTAYALDGERRFHRFGDRPVRRLQAVGRYAYATLAGQRRSHVIDLRTGRTVQMLRTATPPTLLVR
jgi:hypothetical protein